MNNGYSLDWSYYDKMINGKFQKPSDVRYDNWFPFKSPKEKWFAFYGKSYTDIFIYDFETKEHIKLNTYRGPEKNQYWDHTNFSTYVPSYFNWTSVHKDKTYNIVSEDSNLDASYERHGLTVDTLSFLPLAFNAWTIWAADYEFYVDVLDLSDIDNGNISVVDKQYIISRDAHSMRDFVKIDLDNSDGVTYAFFEILTVDMGLSFNTAKRNNFQISGEPISNSPLLPWQKTEKHIAERDKIEKKFY